MQKRKKKKKHKLKTFSDIFRPNLQILQIIKALREMYDGFYGSNAIYKNLHKSYWRKTFFYVQYMYT